MDAERREREDLMGGGTSSASANDSQGGEGGFHEGYWRCESCDVFYRIE